MPRITRVKSAQPRYRMVPVIDEETGRPKASPVIGRNGQPKVKRKTGTPITRRVTVADKSQPLPNRTCGKCHQEIKVGDSYLWWANRSPGMRGGSKRYRCARRECFPKPWETEGNPKRAALMLAEHNLEEALSGNFEDVGDVESALTDFAEAVREIASELSDGADNIESGFGHETSTSAELRERAENIERAADDAEQVDLPDPPDSSDYVLDDEGDDLENPDEEDADSRFDANGTSLADAWEQWRDECRDRASEAVQEVDLG